MYGIHMGYYFAYPYNFLLVRQDDDGMRVVSRHKKLTKARRAIATAHRLNPDKLFALLPLIGNPRTAYKAGDVLNSYDVSWSQIDAKERCSECCNPYAYGGYPKSLNHKCVIFRGNPVCERIKQVRVPRD